MSFDRKFAIALLGLSIGHAGCDKSASDAAVSNRSRPSASAATTSKMAGASAALADAPAGAIECPAGAIQSAEKNFCISLPATFKPEPPETMSLGRQYEFRSNDAVIKVRAMPLTQYEPSLKQMAQLITPENFDTVEQGKTLTGEGQFLHYRNKHDKSETIYAYYKGSQHAYLCLADGILAPFVKAEIFEACKNLKVE